MLVLGIIFDYWLGIYIVIGEVMCLVWCPVQVCLCLLELAIFYFYIVLTVCLLPLRMLLTSSIFFSDFLFCDMSFPPSLSKGKWVLSEVLYCIMCFFLSCKGAALSSSAPWTGRI